MSPKPLCVLALLLVVLVGSSSAQRVDYSGYTEYDGRPAVLTLTFNGPVVTGNLFVSPVCEEGMHLTGVDIDLRGLAIGPWESATYPVIGNWSGGDTDPCDASSTIRNNPMYPNNGTFTIYMTKTNDGKDAVKLVRWLVTMRTSYGYLFGSKGSVYEGAGGNGSTGKGVDLVVVSVLDDPSQAAAASDQLTFTMELKNLGTVEVKGFNVGFYLSPDPSITADDIYIGYGVVDLKPGESRSGPVPCKIPADITPGLYYIGVIADPQEKVVESDETNNAKATEDPVRIPRSLVIISSGSDDAGSDLASGRPGSGSAVVHLQNGQMYTFQMPEAGWIYGGKSFSDAGIISVSHNYDRGYENSVAWGPSDVLSGDGLENLGSRTSITLTAVGEGTANVDMRAQWVATYSNGSVIFPCQNFHWTVIVGSFGSDNDTDTRPGNFSGTVSKGEIISGKIKGKAIYRPTGEPVAGATIISLDFEDEARGSYPIQKLNSDGLKTGSDGTFEIDIATCIPSGVDPGTFWIRIIKFYDGRLVKDPWLTTNLDLWVVQSPSLNTFTLTKESAQAGPIDVGIVMMDKACKVFGTECPYEPNWP